MVKRYLGLMVIAGLTACGGGTLIEEDIPLLAIASGPNNPLPAPFVLGPAGQAASQPAPTNTPLPFVIGPVTGNVVTTMPVVTVNYCKPDSNGFIVGPCVPAEAPKPNYCTNGFVIGPCTPVPTCFVAGPNTSCTP